MSYWSFAAKGPLFLTTHNSLRANQRRSFTLVALVALARHDVKRTLQLILQLQRATGDRSHFDAKLCLLDRELTIGAETIDTKSDLSSKRVLIDNPVEVEFAFDIDAIEILLLLLGVDAGAFEGKLEEIWALPELLASSLA